MFLNNILFKKKNVIVRVHMLQAIYKYRKNLKVLWNTLMVFSMDGHIMLNFFFLFAVFYIFQEYYIHNIFT